MRTTRGKGRGNRKGKNKENVDVRPAPEGSPRHHLEHVQQACPEDRVGEKEDADFERREAEEKIKSEESTSDRQLGELLELGKMLDWPTENQEYWREVVGVNLQPSAISHEEKGGEAKSSATLWKMPKGDVWVEQHLKIRSKLGHVKLIKLNPAQLRYSYDCAEKHAKRNIVLKARQVGITSYIAARFFVQTITRPGTLTMLVAHDKVSAEEIFRIVHRFWDNLEERLRKGVLKTSHNSGRELVFPHLDSEYTVASADENAGRGRTIQNLHCTEVSRWGRDAGEALASLRAAVVPNGEIVLESTANGAWGPFYEEWQKAEEEGYLQHFFPWWYEETYRCVRGNELLAISPELSVSEENPHPPQKTRKGGAPEFEMTEEEEELVRKHGLKIDQILWRRQQWATLRSLARQEFAEDPVTCFRASGECVFELSVVDEALSKIGEPVEVRENGRVSIWLPAQTGKEYLIGVDPAGGGIDGDYSCAEVIDRVTGAQCAELHGHYDLRDLAKELIKLGKEYNQAMLAVERNNHGHAVLVQLEYLDYRNVYKQKGNQGWYTTAANRPEMIERMAVVLADKPELLRSARLWNECRTFVRHADGTTGAASGAHDDCVMAMAVAMAVREEEMGKHSHQPSAVSHQAELCHG